MKLDSKQDSATPPKVLTPHGRPVQSKWTSAEVASNYASTRFSSSRGRERDPQLVLQLLKRHTPDGRAGRLLDLPCGTGRLFPKLHPSCSSYLGTDVSSAMVEHAPHPAVVGDAFHLPFGRATFDTVVCCRLLHHLDEREELGLVLEELVRVSSDLVIASFWDADSWPAFRRRMGWRVESTGRRPVQKKRVRRLLESSGAEVLGFAHSFRYVSMQCFVAARVRRDVP